MQQGAADGDKITDQRKTGSQYPRRQPVEGMAQLHGALTQSGLLRMLGAQGQQAISQRRHGAEQQIPEDNGEKALIGLPQQMPLNLLQQFGPLLRLQCQITFGHVVSRLTVTTPPGVAKRPQRCKQITTPQAVDQYQQMHRQRQPAICQRLEDQQQQAQRQHRQQHQNGQAQPRGLLQAALLQALQLRQPGAVLLDAQAPGGKLLDPQHQQNHQKTHCYLSFNSACRRAQSNAAPGSVLRPGAISLWPRMRCVDSDG